MCSGCCQHSSIEMDGKQTLFKCKCGQVSRMPVSRPSAEGVLTALGYTLSVDWDGALMVDSDNELPQPLYDWLFAHQADLRSSIEWEGKMERACFTGGPLNGQRHHCLFTHHTERRVHKHIKRGHWETYEFRERNDSRMYYVGRSTSEAKAKRGEFVTAKGIDTT